MKTNNWLKFCEEAYWHDAAKIYPVMPGDELKELAEDIQANGLQNRIALFENKVLDGRNRLLACRLVNVEPEFYDWQPEGRSPLTWVLSQNTRRRHLTQGQKAFVALARISHPD